MKHFCSRFFTTKLASNFFASITLFFVILSSTNIYSVGQTVDPKIDTQQIEEILEANSVSEKDGTVGEQALGDVQNESNENQEKLKQELAVELPKTLKLSEEKVVSDNDVKVVFQNETTIKAGDDTVVTEDQITVKKLEAKSVLSSAIDALEIGKGDKHLIFDKPVKVEVGVEGVADNENIEVKVKHTGDTDFGTKDLVNEQGNPQNIFAVVGGKVTFYTLGASTFILNAAGVTNNTVWLKSESLPTSGSISSWTNSAVGTNNATQATATDQPTVGSINFNKAANFDGTNDHLLGAGNNGFYADNIFVVVNPTNTINSASANNAIVTGFGGSTADVTGLFMGSHTGRLTNEIVGFNMLDASQYGSGYTTTTGSISGPQVLQAKKNGNSEEIYLQGLRVDNSQVNAGTYASNYSTTSNTQFIVGAGRQTTSLVNRFLSGSVGEVIIYKAGISTNNATITSYLASKFGITLDQSTAQNYIDSAGTAYWNGTTNSAFKNNITVIGRDDDTTLNQKQSKSVNTVGLVTAGRGGISASNSGNTNTFANNKSYFSFGDDNGANSWSSTGAPSGRQILTRKFKGQNTNFSETVKLSVSDNSSTNTTKLPAEITTVYLLVDADGDGNFTTGSPTETALTLNGTEWETATPITIPNGAVFTFATQVPPAPGGVAGSSIWIKADSGVTGTTAVSAWADQSGNGNNLAQATFANQPNATTQSFNFNPTVGFDGTSDFMNGTNPILFKNGYAVYKGNNATTGTLVSRAGGSGSNNAYFMKNSTLNAGDDEGGLNQTYVYASGANIGSQNPRLANLDIVSGAAPSGSLVRVDGLGYTTSLLAGIGTMLNHTNTPRFGRSEDNAQPDYLNANLAEFVMFPTSHTSGDKNKIESYLATKYGITLDQTTAQNYTDSSSAIYWNATTNSAYNKNITAIGRDDTGTLNQKQSKSVNTAGLVTVGRGSIAATNLTNVDTFSNDKSYFAFGDDNGSLTWTPTGAPANRQILGRKFKAQSTNYSQTLKITTPDNSSTSSTKLAAESANTVYLLVDTDGDGNFTTGSPTEVAMTLNGTNWETSATIPTGAVFTFATAVGDDDGDGILNSVECSVNAPIVYARATVGTQVWLPTATGQYNNTPVNTALGGAFDTGTTSTEYATIADTNKDGIGDKIWAWQSGNTVNVYLGSVSGTFATTPIVSNMDTGAFQVGKDSGKATYITDVTGDTIPDIVTATEGGGFNDIRVFPGLGDGKFRSGVTLTQVNSMRAGYTNAKVSYFYDVTGDGKADYINALEFSNIRVWKNLGEGRYEQNPIVTAVGATWDVGFTTDETTEMADVNKDGILDIIAAHAATDKISVTYGIGNGTFNPTPVITNMPGSFDAGYGSSEHGFVTDANGDGNPDVVWALSNNGTGTEVITVNTGFGDGTFATSPITTTATASNGFGFDADRSTMLNTSKTDTDGDGFANCNDPDDDNDGVLTSVEGQVDADGDGTPNYLDPDDDNDGVPTRLEDTNTNGNWTDDDINSNTIPAYLDPNEKGGKDNDGDGVPNSIECKAPSISFGITPANTITTWTARGDGSLLYNNSGVPVTSPVVSNVTGLDSGDAASEESFLLDATGDGKADWIYTLSNNPYIVWVFPGLANNQFSSTKIITTMPNTFRVGRSNDTSTEMKDVTGDGLVDIVYGDEVTDVIQVWKGIGGGKFDINPITTAFTGGVFAGDSTNEETFLIDTNGDQIFDWVWTYRDPILASNRKVHVYLGQSGVNRGKFAITPIITTMAASFDVGTTAAFSTEMGDVNGDGRVDIVAGRETTSIVVWPGLGTGSFSTTPITTTMTSNFDAGDNVNQESFLLDFTQDGVLDWVYASDTLFKVFKGKGDGTFELTYVESKPTGMNFGTDNNESTEINFSIVDADGDGISNCFDTDDDGDGVPTANEGLIDTDSDGIPDYLDPDDDNDTIRTIYENLNNDSNWFNDDTDGDGTPNFRDNDDDGDGLLTSAESPDPNGDGNPVDAVDSNSNGLPNYLEGTINVTINQASGQADPQTIGAVSTNVTFTSTFTQDITSSSFINSDVTLGGTATGCTVSSITANPAAQLKIFDIVVNCGSNPSNHNKTIIPSLASSVVTLVANPLVSNSASTSTDNTVTLQDTTPPSAPSAPDMTSGTDLGSSNSDNNTSDSTPDFTGSCTNGETVTLFVDGIANGSQVCSGGTYTITPTTPISQGLHNITTKFTDPAGNQSAVSPILPIIIDTTAPSAPAAPDMTGATDTGSSNSDNITSDTTPDFTGTCTNGETITIRVDGTPISPTQVCSGGTYTITPLSPIASGSRSITTTATDLAGNTSSPSSALNITIDNSIPTTPASSPDMTAATDTGASNTDNITNNSQPTFTDTCTTGNTVTLFVDGTAITPTQVCVGGVYNITPSSPISSGNHSITNKETNPAGNTSSSSPALSITIDTTPPATPTTAPDMTAATDSGSSNTDNTTNDNTPDFTGTCTPGDTITIFVDGVANGSQVCNGGGTYTITASPAISDGPHNVTIKTTDPAGNQSAASPALPITIDTSAPSAPTSSPDMTPGTDTGSSNTDNNTSDNTPTFTGSCTSGDTVTLFVDGTAVAPSTVCTGGNYSITPSSPISDGSHNITTKFTDPAGNQSAASPNLPIVIDSTAPTTLGTPDMNPATDSGISNTDNITNEDQPTFDGTCTNGDVITLYVDGSAIAPTAVCTGGNYSITPSSPISNGTHSITVTATDTAGNTSAPSTPLNITIDTSVPSAPTAPDMTAATDSGSSSTDNITSDSTPDFTGTCTNGETIRVYVDGIAIIPTQICSGGVYTITPSTPLTNGGHSITTTTTDLGGNESPQSPALTITIDTTGLTVVVNKAPAQAQATNVQPVKFEITFSEAINSSSLTTSDIVLSTFDNLGTITAINQISPTVFEVVVQGLTIRPVSQNNPVSISLAANAVTDLAGNTSTASTNGSQPIVDYAVPPPYVIPQITNNPSPTLTGACSPNANLDITVNSIVYPTTCTAGGTWSQVVTAPNGTYNVLITDNTNNVNNSTTQPSLDELVIDTAAPTVVINQKSGQPDPTNQASILFTVNIGENGSNINPSTFSTADFTLGGTATGTITNMVQVSPGVYEVTVTPTTSGTVILSMNAGVFTDNAGNLNTASTSTDNTVTFDNILPVAPTVNPLNTNDTTPTITGTCENGTTISVQVGSQTMNTTCSGGTYSVTVGAPLPDNTYNVFVTSTDSAGNQSVDGTSNELVIDTVAPSAPTAPDMTAATDTGSSNTDNNTSDTTPDFTGSCTPGETINLFVDGIANGSQLCPGSGTYTITPPTPLTNGIHNITTTSTDLAGNQSAASPILPIIIDTSAPIAPVVSSPAPNANVNDNTPTFTGTGEPGATITIMDGTTPICTAVVQPNGSWTCTPSSPLTDGPHTINITQTDPAGNVSPTTSLPINIDTVAPAAPTSSPDMTPGTDTGSSNTDNNTSDTTPTLTGTCTNGETVKLYVDGFAVAPSVVCSGGTYSITPTNPIPDGNHNLTTTFTDLSGNESAPSPALSVVIDSTPPNTPSSPTNTSPATDNTPTFTGSCTPGETVTIVIDGNAVAPTQICPVGGTYSITPTTPLTDGSHNVQAQFTDPAGNVSPLSPAITISIDTSVPVAPVVSSPAPNANLNDSTPTFTGTGEPGATITLLDGTTPICTAVVQPNGSWTCTPLNPLTDGPHTINVTQTDPAGNVSPTTTLSINIDTVAPVAPAIGGPISGSIVTTDKPTFTGAGESGATVTVKDANGTVVCSVIVDSTGNWSCTPAISQGEGTKSFTAIQTDPAGNSSPASSPVTTITIDVNTDGTDKATEDAAPNGGDGNGDGTLDSEQDTVTSKPNSNVSGGYNTLEVTGLAGSCARIGDFDFKVESVLGSQDVPRDYPIGLFKFRIFCMTPGGSAQVKILLDKVYNTNGWIYKKYNTQTNQYAEMQGVTYGIQTIGGNQVTTINFVAVDGGPFDEDGLANGEYVDPSGPSIDAPATQPQSPTPLARTGYNFGLSLILGGITALIVSSINMKKRKE
jgi:hypothetical protein